MVLIVKVVLLLPLGITTMNGTLATELLLCSITKAPNEGAVPLSVTVPVADWPPTTLDGLIVREASVAGLTVRTADLFTPA